MVVTTGGCTRSEPGFDSRHLHLSLAMLVKLASFYTHKTEINMIVDLKDKNLPAAATFWAALLVVAIRLWTIDIPYYSWTVAKVISMFAPMVLAGGVSLLQSSRSEYVAGTGNNLQMKTEWDGVMLILGVANLLVGLVMIAVLLF